MKYKLLILLLSFSLVALGKTELYRMAFNFYEKSEFLLASEILSDKKAKLDVDEIELLADCYKKMGLYEKAESTYAQVVEKRKDDPQCILTYARLLMQRGQYEKAKQKINEFSKKTWSTKEVKILLESCDSAMAWMKKSPNFVVRNDVMLNTPYSEYPVSFQDRGIIFSSNRSDVKKTTDLRYTLYSGVLTPPAAWKDITPYLKEFKGSYHVGGFTTNGGNAFITSNEKLGFFYFGQNNKKRNMKLYYGRFRNSEVHEVEPFERGTRNYNMGHATLSKNGRTLYFISDMPGGYGGTDIYYSEMTASGWSVPKNLGPQVNTEGNEMFPYVEGEYIYFASDGHVGFGGLDIYRSKGSKGSWTTAQNLGYPLNTPADDFGLIIYPDQKTGYFASNRYNGKDNSDDIYHFTLVKSLETPVPPVKKEVVPIDTVKELPPPPVVDVFTLLGAVEDIGNNERLRDVKVCIISDLGDVSCETTDALGQFSLKLNKGREYRISGFKEGYEAPPSMPLVWTPETFILKLAKKTKKRAEDVIDDYSKKYPVVEKPTEFRIQILASRIETDWSYFDKIRREYPQFNLQYAKSDGYTKFTYGSFATRAEADKYIKIFTNLGYPSFVVYFVKGVQTKSFFKSEEDEKAATKAPAKKATPNKTSPKKK